MGIMNFVKGGVKELAIARPDEAKQFWVYKHPDQTVPMKAQLTVDQDEVALFYRDGKFQGQLGPGRHTLESGNIPFLGQLVDKFTGGNVFIAEVFFVNTREMADQKFGTTIGNLKDPETGMRARLMVNGTYSAKIFDPPRMINGLVGQGGNDGNAFTSWFRDLVSKTLKDDIAELIVKKKWPLLDVTSGAYTEELEEEAIAGVRKHIESYGVEIIRFGDFRIAIDPKDQEKIDKILERTQLSKMAQGPGYAQMAQAEMMMGAAEGMKSGGGGGAALEGAGLGMGMAMAGGMMNNMMGGQNQAAAPPPPLPDQGSYHYNGPSGQNQFPLSGVVQQIMANRTAQHLVWQQGWASWKNWTEVPEIASQVPPDAAPPPAPGSGPDLSAIFHYSGPQGKGEKNVNDIVGILRADPDGAHFVWQNGYSEWKPAKDVPEIQAALGGSPPPPPAPPSGSPPPPPA